MRKGQKNKKKEAHKKEENDAKMYQWRKDSETGKNRGVKLKDNRKDEMKRKEMRKKVKKGEGRGQNEQGMKGKANKTKNGLVDKKIERKKKSGNVKIFPYFPNLENHVKFSTLKKP